MKIAFLSDIHVEFKDQRVIPLGEHVDVLVVAGDIHTKGRGLAWAYETYRERARNIVVVFGNHDYWKGTYQKILLEARAYAQDKPGLFFLENDTVCIDGVWFIGATCWTDFDLGPETQAINMFIYDGGMNDGHNIKWNASVGSYRKTLARDVKQINTTSKRYIFKMIDEIRGPQPNAPIVVVTHHGPTSLSLDPFFARSKLNASYVNVWHRELLHYEPNLWIHGHVHIDRDYQIGTTRVLCNPIGYPGQIPGAKIEVLELEESVVE